MNANALNEADVVNELSEIISGSTAISDQAYLDSLEFRGVDAVSSTIIDPDKISVSPSQKKANSLLRK